MSELKKEKLEFAPDYLDVPGSDLILISSDGIGFKVLSKNLADSSEVFASMLDTCENDNVEGKEAEVQLTETSETLNSIIPFIYGKKIQTPKIEFPQSMNFIKALLKYEIHSGLMLVTEIMHRLTYEAGVNGKDLYHIYCYAYEMEESQLKRRVMLALFGMEFSYSHIRELSKTATSFSTSANAEFISRWSNRVVRALEVYSLTDGPLFPCRDPSCYHESIWYDLAIIHDSNILIQKTSEDYDDMPNRCDNCKSTFSRSVSNFLQGLRKIEYDEADEHSNL